jgi:hypothetical protein
VADQVGGDHGVLARQIAGDSLPVAGGVEHPVDEHDRRPGAGDAVDDAATVQLDLPLLELRRAAEDRT